MSIFLDQSQCHGVPQLQWPIFLLPYIHNSFMVKYVGLILVITYSCSGLVHLLMLDTIQHKSILITLDIH